MDRFGTNKSLLCWKFLSTHWCAILCLCGYGIMVICTCVSFDPRGGACDVS